MKNYIISLVIISVTIISFTTIHAQNLLTNGDFESGGHTNGFFVHNYTVINPVNGSSNPKDYAWTSNPNLMNTSFISSGDHTTGSGKMLVFDGATSANQYFWTTGSTGGAIGGFTAGTTYTFSFWIKSVSNDVTNSTTQASINAFFVNATNINPSNTNFLAPLPAADWQQIAFTFQATANNAMVRLFTSSTSTIGNNFAVDDFSITAGSLPLSLTITSSLNPTCPSSLDGSIIASAKFGVANYTYNLTGTKTLTNGTGVFTSLPEGTYNIEAVDNAGTKTPKTVIVLSAPNSLIVSPDTSSCPGVSTTLTASGSTKGYTWTALPLDPTLTTPNSPSITVKPTQTTTYTVTTGGISNPTNLVNNGDFSFGDNDFTSDYLSVPNPNPFGVKGAYGIVTNPKTWFTAFDPCPDHTTGTGNMMVVDGSDTNAGNNRLWIQNITVVPNQDYDFSYYLQTLSAGAPARIEVVINGVSMGPPVNAPTTKCLWEKHLYTWNSGSNTTATVFIYDRETSGGGNDFAIDDISLNESVTCIYEKKVTVTVSNPNSLIITNPPAACAPATVDITSASVTAGSTSGTLTYWTDLAGTIPLLNPSTISIGNTYYIKNTIGTCAVIKPVVVTINTSGSIAAPVVTTPVNYCQNSVAIALTATALPSTTLNWYGTNAIGGSASTTAPTPLTTSIGTLTYYVSQTLGTCESLKTGIDVVISALITPTFNPIPTTICKDAVAPILPTSSTNTPAITGTWNPSIINTSTITTTTYTFSPIAGSCATQALITITVNPNTTPVFDPIAPICSGETLSPLPTTSKNGITGTWLPALDNTKTTTYTFTPTSGSCASLTTLEITVNPNTIPTFDPIPEICVGASLAPLPTTSTNGITGTWLPPLDNTKTTTYTFTPSSGQCATLTTLVITINTTASITPIFATTPPSCSGQILSALPTTSLNNITGTWTPALDNTKTTTYTFKPNPGQCALTTTQIINIISTPMATATPSSSTICSGNTTAILLSSSIIGTTFDWNAIQTNVTGAVAGTGDTIDQILTTIGNKSGEAVYSVTPTVNGCPGLPIQIKIIVNPIPVVTANPNPLTICSGESTDITLSSDVVGVSFSWTVIQTGVLGAFSATGSSIVQTLKNSTTLQGTAEYTITPTSKGCIGIPLSVIVTVNPTPEVFGSSGTTICSGESTNIILSPNILGTEFSWTVNQTRVSGASDGTGDSIKQILDAETSTGKVVYTITPTLTE